MENDRLNIVYRFFPKEICDKVMNFHEKNLIKSSGDMKEIHNCVPNSLPPD